MNYPNCNSSSVAEILYGYYPNMYSIKEALDKKEIVLGGCVVTEHDPRWECNSCNHRWGGKRRLIMNTIEKIFFWTATILLGLINPLISIALVVVYYLPEMNSFSEDVMKEMK